MNKYRNGMLLVALTLVFACGSASPAFGQAEPSTGDAEPKVEKPATEQASQPAAEPQPAITELAGVSLGMTADEARKKLGKPDVSDKEGMLFTPGDNQSIQIGLDPKGTVRTIAIIYTEGNDKAMSFEDVFGAGVEKPDSSGNVYKLVRYPSANVWLSYSLTNADSKPTTVITMRRLN